MAALAADCHHAASRAACHPAAGAKEEPMDSNRHKQCGATALTVILALAGALVAGSPQPAGAQYDRDGSRHRTLEGTWWVRVTAFADCTSRQPLASFSALLTFAHGGTMTGTTTNPAFSVGQRSPDHGIWFRTGRAHRYKASSVALVLFTTAPNLPLSPGFQAGSQRLDQTIDVTDPDHFSSDAVSRFFDVTGRQYRELCAAAVGERFE
jgi:hypothetical protein